MKEYQFENKEGLTFIQCKDENRNEIINAKISNRCQVREKNSPFWMDCTPESANDINLEGIYRTVKPAPTPNQIDWSLVPKEYKYLITAHHGGGVLTTRIPVEEPKGAYLMPGAEGELLGISEDTYGFKRGTVRSIDSLLVRPLGE